MKVQSVPVSKIWYDQESRQRQDLGDVSDLVQSIGKVGLLQPLVVTDDFELIAGERRLTAIKQLGLLEVDVRFLSDLNETERRRIELDENIRRKDLTWQESVLAHAEYHTLLVRDNGKDWTLEDTAAELGTVVRTLSNAIRLARAISNGDKAVAEAPQLSIALSIVTRQDQRERDSSQEKIAGVISSSLANVLGGQPPVPVKSQEVGDGPGASSVSLSPTSAPVPPESVEPYRIIQGDFIAWADRYSGPRFNFLHIDFPYGIGFDEYDQGVAGRASGGTYSDTKETYQKLMAGFKRNQSRLVADSAHVLFWFPMRDYNAVYMALTFMNKDWKVHPTPFIWHKSDNAGFLPDRYRQPRFTYESAFLVTIGDRYLVGPKANSYSCGIGKREHSSEKPREMLSHFLSMFVDKHSHVLDPTCGSANALAVAIELGASSAVGIEFDPDHARTAEKNLKGALNGV